MNRALIAVLALAVTLGTTAAVQAAVDDNILRDRADLTVVGRWGNANGSSTTTALNDGNLGNWADVGTSEGYASEDAFVEVSWDQPVWIDSFRMYGRSGGYEPRLDGGQLYIYNGATLVASILDPTPTTPTTDNELIRVSEYEAGLPVVAMTLDAAVQATRFLYVGQRETRGYTNLGEIQIFEAAAPIPEPATMSLLALGGLAAMIRRRRS